MDHRTLVAQRDAALELASAARERGDEGAELHETVRAVALDRPPLAQLSPGAWQMKERGLEVGRVGAWHEARARAAEVMEVARELAGQVRDWLDQAAERVLDRLGPGQTELALAGGRDGQDREPDLATRLREAWATRQSRGEAQEVAAPERDRETPQDLAARLRAAAKGIDREALAERAAALRESREGEERQAKAEEAERQRARELALELEQEREACHRDRGLDYGI